MRELGIGLVPFSPLGRGYLTGALQSSSTFVEGDFRRGLPRFDDAHMAANRKLVDIVKSVAQRRGATTAQVALAWKMCIRDSSMVAPHPAPAAAAQLFGADLGLSIVYGVAVSIPMAIIGGIFYGGWLAKRMNIPVPAISEEAPKRDASQGPPPSLGVVILLLLLPCLLYTSQNRKLRPRRSASQKVLSC